MNREELIEKAAKAIRNAMYQDEAHVEMLAEDELEYFSGVAVAAFAVFEEAHTPVNVSEPGKTDIPSAQMSLSGQIPTDDEREALIALLLKHGHAEWDEFDATTVADVVLAAGFHRPAQGEQGEGEWEYGIYDPAANEVDECGPGPVTRDSLTGIDWDATGEYIVRRHKAGPWLPVEDPS